MEVQHSNNFCVETKGACFFCLEEYATAATKSNGSIPNNDGFPISFTISLKRLAKYLNVDLRNVFKLNIPLQRTNMRTSDVFVPLCEECTKLIRKFSELHHELEVVKMHMNSCVHAIRAKMVKVDSEQEHTTIYRKRWVMSNPVDAIQSQIVHNLRKETREKCSRILARSLPRVKLERLRERNNHTNQLSTRGNHAYFPKQAGGRNNAKQENDSAQTRRLVTSTGVPEKVKERASAQVVVPQNSVGQRENFNPKQPSIPRSPFPVSEMQTCDFPKSMIAKNVPINVFSVKPHSLSSEKQTVVTQPPLALVETSKSPHQVTTAISSSFDNSQSTSSTRYVPVTSASRPLPIAENDSTKINQSLTKENTNSHQQPPQSAGSYDCAHCGQVFGEKSTLRTHVVRSHCEQFFTTLKDRNLSSEEFKSIVNMLFKDVARSHTIANGSASSPSKSTFTCPHCNVKHDSDGDVYAHMFRFHYTDLTSKLLSLQKEIINKREIVILEQPTTRKESGKRDKPSSSFLCSWCGMTYASKRTLNFHQSYNCRKRDSSAERMSVSSSSTVFQATPNAMVAKFKCMYCDKGFPFYYEHRVHTLTSHRIEEFSKYVSTGVTLNQVDFELKRILQTYRKVPENQNAGGCLFCPEVFSKVVDLQNHILVGHFDVVVFKLRSILPQQTLHINETNDSLMDSSQDIVEISNETDIIDESIVALHMPVQADNPSLPACDSLEIIMQQDPLSRDLLNSEAIVCQEEEEQLKMEWLFSFIDEDDQEVGAQSQAIDAIDEDKCFLFENNYDSELIIP